MSGCGTILLTTLHNLGSKTLFNPVFMKSVYCASGMVFFTFLSLSLCLSFFASTFFVCHQLEEALRSKEAELQDAYDKLSQRKEDLELLNQRIAEEEAEVERLRRELGDGKFVLSPPLQPYLKVCGCVVVPWSPRTLKYFVPLIWIRLATNPSWLDISIRRATI